MLMLLFMIMLLLRDFWRHEVPFRRWATLFSFEILHDVDGWLVVVVVDSAFAAVRPHRVHGKYITAQQMPVGKSR